MVIQKRNLQPDFIKTLCEDDTKALQFIAEVKWEQGFACRKCGHTNYCPGKTAASRRCTRCKKEESATAHTIFHNCKFPIHKAFYIVSTVCFDKKKISANDLSSTLGLNPMTCWKFRKKIQDCIEAHENKPNEEINLKEILLTS